MVSMAGIRLDSRKFVRSFKGIICVDISEFESYMPSHAVRSPSAKMRVVPTLPIHWRVVESAAAVPGGWNGLAYFRLHGSPRVYYSKYRPDQIEWFAQQLGGLRSDHPVWCIFDNTAAGAATANALALQERVGGQKRRPLDA